MISPFFLFLKKLLYFSVLLGLLCIGLTFLLPHNYLTPTLPYLFIFFFSVTLLMFYILLKASEKNFRQFITLFSLSTFIKLFLFLGVILFYVFIHRADAISFLITFLIFYICYQAFEIYHFILFSKNKKQVIDNPSLKN